MEKYYKIAGLTVKMDSFGRTVEQARHYETAPCETPDITVVSNWPVKKPEYPDLSDSDGEYLATGASFYKELLNHDGLMLHSSAVVLDGRAYLFTADCGTGKSTHTGLWLKAFGDRAYILNDDKPALRLENGVWYAYGTPWSGKHDISVDARVPVGGIALVIRSHTNRMEPLTGLEAVTQLLRQATRSNVMEYRAKLLELTDLLIRGVPIWKLYCNMDVEAALVAHSTMSAQ